MAHDNHSYKWVENMRDDLENNQHSYSNFFEYKTPKTYYNFANEIIDVESQFTSDNTHTFKIPVYGDLIDKVYLSFSLPRLTPNHLSSWVSWKNYIGLYCIENVEIMMNNITIERLQSDTLYSQFKHKNPTPHKNVLSRMVGECFTDIQLRKNANKTTKYIIPLHLFFTKVSYNAIPINRNNDITISITFKDTTKLFLSSNMLPPRESFSIQPVLNVGYVYLSKDEYSQMNTSRLVYNIEKTDGFTVNVNNKSTNLTTFVDDMKPKLLDILKVLPNCYIDTFSYFENYSKYVYCTYPQYIDFYNSNFENIVIVQGTMESSYSSAEYNLFSSLNDIHVYYSNAWGNGNVYYQSIEEYINSINSITGHSRNWFINSFLFENDIDFQSIILNSIDYSSSQFIDSWYNSFDIDFHIYSSESTPSIFINSILDRLDEQYNSLIASKNSLSIKKNSYFIEWNSITGNSYRYVNIPFIQLYNSNIEFTLNEMNTIKSEYQSLKTDIEFEQLPPLTQYIKTYMNELELYLTKKDERVKKDKCYKSDLNIFSFNNTIFINSQNSEQYQVGNYYSNCFQYYFSTPNCGYWNSSGDAFQSITPHSNINKYRSSLERVLSNSTFFHNSVPFTYFINDNMKINIKDHVLHYSEFIIDEATINTTDYNNAIDIIDGLNLIVLGREQNNTFDFQDIKDDIHNNIKSTIHNVIYNRYDTFYSNAIQPQITKSLDSLEYGTQYLYTITNSIRPNSFNSYHNDTILTLLQYKNDGWNSNSLLSKIYDFIPVIEIFENLYDSFTEMSAKLSSIIEINSQYANNSEIIYKLSRKLLETESDSFQNFVFKNEFHSPDTIDFNSTNITINSCIGYVKFNLNKLWLKQFAVIKKRYGDNNGILNKHKDRYFEHIRNMPYKLKDYVTESMNLNLIDIYEELLNLDTSTGDIAMESKPNESNYIYFGIMDQLNIQRRRIIFYDTIGYELKDITEKYLSTVSYPIRIDDMNTASNVYESLNNNIDRSIERNSNLLNESTIILSQSINPVIEEIKQLNNSIYELNKKYNMVYIFEEQCDIPANYDPFMFNDIHSVFYKIKNAVKNNFSNLVTELEEHENNEDFDTKIKMINNKIDNMSIHYDNRSHRSSLSTFEINTGRLLSLPIKCIYLRGKENPIINPEKNLKKITISFEQSKIEISGDLLYSIKSYLYSNHIEKGVYCLPFCLYTESLFPSGSISFTKNVSVKMEFTTWSFTETVFHIDVVYYDQLVL